MRKLPMIFGVVAVTLLISSTSIVKASTKLTDISNTKYEEAITNLVSRNIIHGFPDDTFKPTEKVTRAQMAKMIVEGKNLKNIENASKTTFSDLSSDYWANSYIQIAVENNIITGYPDGTFAPEKNVTYAEAMAMILRGMNKESSMKDKTWPTAYMTEASKLGLLKDVEYTDVSESATRGNIALALYQMIQKE